MKISGNEAIFDENEDAARYVPDLMLKIRWRSGTTNLDYRRAGHAKHCAAEGITTGMAELCIMEYLMMRGVRYRKCELDGRTSAGNRPDGSYDTITICDAGDVAGSAAELRALVAEARSLLKPDGKIYISAPEKRSGWWHGAHSGALELAEYDPVVLDEIIIIIK